MSLKMFLKEKWSLLLKWKRKKFNRDRRWSLIFKWKRKKVNWGRHKIWYYNFRKFKDKIVQCEILIKCEILFSFLSIHIYIYSQLCAGVAQYLIIMQNFPWWFVKAKIFYINNVAHLSKYGLWPVYSQNQSLYQI